ncbi:MAG: cysteine-rich CWC family protein [Gemmatimonadales bacterium]
MPELSSATTDDHTCPLCGQPNGCAMAQGRSVSVCWCTAVRVRREQLEPIPEEHRGVRCLCPACLQALAAGAP